MEGKARVKVVLGGSVEKWRDEREKSYVKIRREGEREQKKDGGRWREEERKKGRMEGVKSA